MIFSEDCRSCQEGKGLQILPLRYAALHAYSRRYAPAGEAFQQQVGHALMGMSYTKKGEALALKWAHDHQIEKSNLLLRAHCLNQEGIEAEVRAGLSQVRNPAPSGEEENKGRNPAPGSEEESPILTVLAMAQKVMSAAAKLYDKAYKATSADKVWAAHSAHRLG